MIVMVLIALVVLLLIWGIATYNRLVTERLKVHTQWSQIDVVLKQRFDLIPNLVETVKGYRLQGGKRREALFRCGRILLEFDRRQRHFRHWHPHRHADSA